MSKYNGLSYDKESYEKTNGRNNNNCYTYAINQPLNPHTGLPYKSYSYCQPGNLGGKGRASDTLTLVEKYQDIMKYVNNDLRKIGYEMAESTFEEYVDDADCWKVAFCYSEWDYHWYRQNADGTWSQKKGMGMVTDLDADDNKIYNPEECNRGSYNIFGGFYIIKKIKSESLNKVA